MSIFGKLDAATVSTNPFWIEAGEYTAEVSKAEYKTNRDNQRQLHIEYTITDEDSRFDGNKANSFFNLVDEDMDETKFATLPKDDQKKITRDLANLKKALCGSDGNSNQPGLGIDPDDLNDAEWDPAVLMGVKVTLAVANWGEKNTGVNVKYANILQD